MLCVISIPQPISTSHTRSKPAPSQSLVAVIQTTENPNDSVPLRLRGRTTPSQTWVNNNTLHWHARCLALDLWSYIMDTTKNIFNPMFSFFFSILWYLLLNVGETVFSVSVTLYKSLCCASSPLSPPHRLPFFSLYRPWVKNKTSLHLQEKTSLSCLLNCCVMLMKQMRTRVMTVVWEKRVDASSNNTIRCLSGTTVTTNNI